MEIFCSFKINFCEYFRKQVESLKFDECPARNSQFVLFSWLLLKANSCMYQFLCIDK